MPLVVQVGFLRSVVREKGGRYYIFGLSLRAHTTFIRFTDYFWQYAGVDRKIEQLGVVSASAPTAADCYEHARKRGPEVLSLMETLFQVPGTMLSVYTNGLLFDFGSTLTDEMWVSNPLEHPAALAACAALSERYPGIQFEAVPSADVQYFWQYPPAR